jgi:hypothetical protein
LEAAFGLALAADFLTGFLFDFFAVDLMFLLAVFLADFFAIFFAGTG